MRDSLLFPTRQLSGSLFTYIYFVCSSLSGSLVDRRLGIVPGRPGNKAG